MLTTLEMLKPELYFIGRIELETKNNESEFDEFKNSIGQVCLDLFPMLKQYWKMFYHSKDIKIHI